MTPWQTPPHQVLITAYDDSAVRDKALAAGYATMITKPATPETIRKALSAIYGHDKGSSMALPTKADNDAALFAPHQGAKILLVEDNPINQEVAIEILREVNLSIDVANNGAEAIQMVLANAYDLVLMDVQMPVMDGLEATQRLRAMPQFARLPILAMTANAFDEDRQLCEAAGMNDFVSKPVHVDDLFAAILRWLPQRQPLPSAEIPVQAAAIEPAEPILDAATAIHRLGGKIALVQKMMRGLSVSGQKFADDFQAAVQGGDIAAAKRSAQSLKSSAGTVGAFALQTAAAKLETACQADDAQRQQAFDVLQAVMAQTLTAMDDYLAANQ